MVPRTDRVRPELIAGRACRMKRTNGQTHPAISGKIFRGPLRGERLRGYNPLVHR